MKRSSLKKLMTTITFLFIIIIVLLTYATINIGSFSETVIDVSQGQTCPDNAVTNKNNNNTDNNDNEIYSIVSDVSPNLSQVEIDTFRTTIYFIIFLIVIIYLYIMYMFSNLIRQINLFENNISNKLVAMEQDNTNYQYMEFQKLKHITNEGIREINSTKEYERKIINNIAHDIRTPLQIINIYNELNDNEYTPLVAKNVKFITNIADDILLIKDKEKLNRPLFETKLNQEIKQIITDYQPLLKSKQEIKFIETSQSTWLIDRFLFKRVLYNIFDNAFKVSDLVEIEVGDTWIAINNEGAGCIEIDQYFINNPQNKRVKSGLGLSIIYDLCAAQSITVQISSRDQKYTTFILSQNIKKKNV